VAHWTAENTESFVHKLAFDFITQLEKRMANLALNQTELARKLGVSEGAVSHVLNNPQNLTLKTIARYSSALGIKSAIVAYDDDDPENKKGLVGSEVFSECWERLGKPRDYWSLNINRFQTSGTTDVIVCPDVRSFVHGNHYRARSRPGPPFIFTQASTESSGARINA
jgi:transcriptional regulator with XRE-family HTH domain